MSGRVHGRAPGRAPFPSGRRRGWPAPARFAALALFLCVLAIPVRAQAPVPVPIGYVELADDPRYANEGAYAGIAFRTLGRPIPGARLGIEDAAIVGQILGAEFGLKVVRAASPAELAAAVRGWAAEGVAFVLSDLPADALLALADAVSGLPVLLINVSATEDRLRGADCRANIVHAIPADAMLTDALVQYLVTKSWTRVLLLKGGAPADARLADALKRSAAKFGAEIVAERDFALTSDPRRRDESNVALMTADVPAHDVVFVADSSGEFGRYVPYQTMQARPVVGSAGLVPHAWHWSWDRYGAPQLQHRFEALASPRRMNDAAWAAYAAVKAVMQAAMRSDPADPAAMRAYLAGDELRLDASKGAPMSFRPWDGQLRQPVLLATADAVIARAPLPKFLHQTNDLDTLGVDAPETGCRR